LQLTELLAAKPSSLGPIKNNQNVPLAFERIQADGRTLDRKPRDVRRRALNLKGKKKSDN
jgi:hypothetical protein